MTIAILGLGKTGFSLAKYFHQKGEEVWGIDDREDLGEMTSGIAKVTDKIFLKGQTPPLEKVGRFFLSPGVDPRHPLARLANKKGIKIEGELDLAYELCPGEIIAITGTNGKSTTTTLLGKILKAAGINTGVGGNLGTPFLQLVSEEPPRTHYVLELSSFQLEFAEKFRPRIAVLLNLSDDHFDRHPTLSEYLRAKAKIFAYQTSQDLAVYNDDDLHVLEAVEGVAAGRLPFSTTKKVHGCYGTEEKIHWAPKGEILSAFDRKDCNLPGLHNLENICAAIACAKALDISDDAIRKILKSFRGLPHRIERVSEINGVSYFDDSKATNVGAVVMSLASFDNDVILILGGRDKGGDYAPLKPLLRAKAKAVLVLGEAAPKILSALRGASELIPVKDMREAVERAYQIAPPGGTVLLSPACSSFDMFRDYHDRGETFKRFVKELEGREKLT